MRLKDKTAIITGAASGIGAATARLFRREGARVVATDLKGVADDGTDAGWLGLAQDVRDAGAWQAVFDAAARRFGRVDILVNSAGINGVSAGTGGQDPEHLALDEWRAIQAVNVEGTMLGCQAAITHMKAQGPERGGAIVNVASYAGTVGSPTATAYGASKAALVQYTKSLALHCGRAGHAIRCNVVNPGPIRTPLYVPLTGTGKPTHIPLQRIGEPGEVAAAILFLASDAASYVSGAALPVDGGLSTT
jgi:3(or 17)beta-hydroxysteroid dehydrogenase